MGVRQRILDGIPWLALVFIPALASKGILQPLLMAYGYPALVVARIVYAQVEGASLGPLALDEAVARLASGVELLLQTLLISWWIGGGIGWRGRIKRFLVMGGVLYACALVVMAWLLVESGRLSP